MFPFLHAVVQCQDPLEFTTKELRKHFIVGDHVKVIAGRHESETGLIVRIENNLAIVFSDLTMHEVGCTSVATSRWFLYPCART